MPHANFHEAICSNVIACSSLNSMFLIEKHVASKLISLTKRSIIATSTSTTAI
uniref:Uncharacterized protein n=1 Tax=Rhizophora mucronata TaxID=61149 RepID=A0A2P2MZP6_RHIMU